MITYEQMIEYTIRKNSYFPRAIEIPWVLEQLGSSYTIITTKQNPFGAIIFNKKILDVGCCWSGFPFYLADEGWIVTGIDILDIKDSIKKHNPQPLDEHLIDNINFDFVKASAFDLPFNDNTFDVVVSISVLEHLHAGYYEWWYERAENIWNGKGELSYEDWVDNKTFIPEPREVALKEMLRVAKEKVIFTYDEVERETQKHAVITTEEFTQFGKFLYEDLSTRIDLLEDLQLDIKPSPIHDIGVVIWK